MSGVVDPAIAQMENLPRRNGELVFEAPWQARAFGIAVALCQEQGIEWDAFRSNLIDEIATWERDHAASGTDGWDYYERWLASLERFVLERELVAAAEVEARVAHIAHADSHDHDHDHDHDH